MVSPPTPEVLPAWLQISWVFHCQNAEPTASYNIFSYTAISYQIRISHLIHKYKLDNHYFTAVYIHYHI
ncbi:MAG: hypothetical protein HQK63_16270 [Desulfamplus sp.]|nr:hypothetical protein [Desulfamplus sp.]